MLLALLVYSITGTGTVLMINVRVTVITFVLTADVAGAPPVSLLALAWAWS